MLRKGKPLPLLVGMQTSTVKMENSVEIPYKKLGVELPYNPEIPLLGIYLKEIRIERDTCTLIIHCSTIYNSWNMEAT